MPGTFVFRPIEAKLTRDTELLGKMDPYCMFMMAGQKFKSTTSSKGGTHPHWQDSITMPMPLSTTETKCLVEIRDENVLKDDSVGSFEMDMMEVQMQGKVRKWFSLYHKDKPAGDLLLEATYMSDMEMKPGMSHMGTGSMEMGQQERMMHGMPMGTMGSMQGKTGTMPTGQMGTMGMTQDPMMHGGMSTGQMGTMGSMQGRTGTMPTGQMGTMGMNQDPMMMHGGMTTGQMGSTGGMSSQQDTRMHGMPIGMGTMGSMQGKTGTMPTGQMGTMGMTQDPMMHGGMSTGQMGTMGSMQGKTGTMPTGQMGTMGMNQDPMMMHGGMPMGTMGTMQGKTETMPSSQMSMNQEPMMMHGGMMGTMSCESTCTNPMHQHEKYKKD